MIDENRAGALYAEWLDLNRTNTCVRQNAMLFHISRQIAARTRLDCYT